MSPHEERNAKIIGTVLMIAASGGFAHMARTIDNYHNTKMKNPPILTKSEISTVKEGPYMVQVSPYSSEFPGILWVEEKAVKNKTMTNLNAVHKAGNNNQSVSAELSSGSKKTVSYEKAMCNLKHDFLGSTLDTTRFISLFPENFFTDFTRGFRSEIDEFAKGAGMHAGFLRSYHTGQYEAKFGRIKSNFYIYVNEDIDKGKYIEYIADRPEKISYAKYQGHFIWAAAGLFAVMGCCIPFL